MEKENLSRQLRIRLCGLSRVYRKLTKKNMFYGKKLGKAFSEILAKISCDLKARYSECFYVTNGCGLRVKIMILPQLYSFGC